MIQSEETQGAHFMHTIELSHSQIESWSDKTYGCPAKWAHQKIWKTPSSPSQAFMLGRSFHTTLEMDTKRLKLGQLPYGVLQLQTRFRTVLDQDLATNDPNQLLSRWTRYKMFDLGEAMIGEYVRTIQPFFLTSEKVIVVEDWFQYPIIDGDIRILIRGKIDVATTDALWDFKTATSMWSDGEQDWKDQATIYLTGMRYKEDPRLQALQDVVFAVFAKKSARTFPTKRTPEQFRLCERKIISVARAMVEAKKIKQYHANVGMRCKWCTFLRACSPGRAFLADNEMEPVSSIQEILPDPEELVA